LVKGPPRVFHDHLNEGTHAGRHVDDSKNLAKFEHF
jgi:hypothetical protein